MKYAQAIIILLVFLMSFSCSAKNSDENNEETVITLFKHYFPDQKNLSENKHFSYKLGDFNGDGIEDIALLFLPDSIPIETTQLTISMPWNYPDVAPSTKYHRSLVIFQNNGGDWFSDKTKVFVFLDKSGVLETPSFNLLVSKKSDKNYSDHSSMLSVKTTNDLLVLPTEAGIDTYIYWNKNSYSFLEPEEIP